MHPVNSASPPETPGDNASRRIGDRVAHQSAEEAWRVAKGDILQPAAVKLDRKNPVNLVASGRQPGDRDAQGSDAFPQDRPVMSVSVSQSA